MSLEWQVIVGSTLVSAAAYDGAAERIYVRLHSAVEYYFDDCSTAEWAIFMASTTSKGEYLTRVLDSKVHKGSPSTIPAPPTIRPEPVPRAIYLNAFRPAQEMSEPKTFAGRRQQVLELADALQSSGSCPLLYGDRGLGKSSLAIQARLIAMGDLELLSHLSAADRALPVEESYLTIFVTCSDRVEDVDALFQLLINAAEDVVPEPTEGSAHATRLVDRKSLKRVTLKLVAIESTKTYQAAKDRETYQSLSVIERFQRIVRLLNETYDARVLFIVDELDRVRDSSGLASLMKNLSSDYLKFLLVGIAQNWSDLLLDHTSVERPIAPIRVPRMLRPELAQIVDLAVDSLREKGARVSFAESARKRLVDVAGGFPWFVHVLGQASLMATVDAGLTVVTEEQVTRSMRDLVTNRFAIHFADAYQKAVRDSTSRELVLRVLANWRGSDIPTSSVYPIMRRLGVSNPAVYRGHLARDEYGPVIMTPGYQDRGLVRFRNEMFKQYVFMVPSLCSGVDERVVKAMRDA